MSASATPGAAMQCPRCCVANRTGVKFCEDCGSRLAVSCAQWAGTAQAELGPPR